MLYNIKMTCMTALLNAGFACQRNTICGFVMQFSSAQR